MKMKKLIVPVVAVAVVLGAAGGGYYAFGRTTDPVKKAQQLLSKGDLRGAQIELRNAVRQNPESPEAHMRLGQTQMQLGDPVAGEKELKTARDLGGDRWTILPILGEAYMQQSRYKDILTEIPPEGPTPEIAARNLMLRAMAQVALNDIDAARATLAAAEKAAPGNIEVLLTGSRLALALKDYDTAEQKVDAVLKQNPNSVDALLMKGQVLAARGDRAGSMAIADKLVAAQPNSAPARLDRANQSLLAGDDKKAQADVNAVLAAQPRNAGATYLNAVLMVRAGKYTEAGTEFQKLGSVASRFPRTLYFQALVAANLGQNEVAIDFANHSVARMPADPDGTRLLARTLLTAKQPDKAIEVLQKAVDAGMNDSQTLDLLGRAYTMTGKGADAVKMLQRATTLAPTDANILTHLASSQMAVGDPASAQTTLEKSVQLAPTQANSGEALVGAALSAGDIDGASAALDRLRAQVGDTEQVGILTGMIKLGRLDLEGGRAAFSNTLKQFPDSITAKLNLAKVLILQGRRPEGEGLLKEILAKEPTNLNALNTYIQLLVTESQFQPAIQAVEAAKAAAPTNLAFTAMQSDLIVRSGDPRRAVAMLQAMRDTEELPPVLLGAMARAQAAAGLNDEARKTYRDILAATPNDLDARRGQVDLLLKLKDIEGAKAALQDALKTAPGNIGVMSAIVNLELQTVGLDGALKMADTLRNNPANLPNSAVLRGDALMQGKRYADAEQAFLAEYKLAPSTPLALRLANAAASTGRDDDATRYLQDWLKRTPDDIDATQMLALLDIKAKRFPDAEKHLLAVLAKRPSDTVALNNMAWLYGLRNDPRGRALAQRAYLQAPTPETADTLGWIMVKQGDAKSGLSLLQQASVQRPADPTVKYHLAVALKDNGQKDDALKVLQPLVASQGDFDDKTNARKLLEDLTPKK
jgi:putative PEP-CTERM system TPR-repeat lipoprotein